MTANTNRDWGQGHSQLRRIFTILGLAAPSQSRLDSLAASGKSATQIRNDLLAWGKKQGGTVYRDMLRTYVSQYTNDPERINRIASEIGSGRDIDEVRETFERLGVEAGAPTYGSPAGGGGGTTDSDPGTLPGVMAGGRTIGVKTADGGRRYYQIYEFPAGSGQFVSYQFNDVAQARATLGANFAHSLVTESWFNQKVIAQAEAEEVVGQSGNWNNFTRNIMRDAAVAAGLNDPTMVGRMASDKEMQAIMAQAMLGDWEPAQILAAQRKTKFWKDVLYPGIENFYGQTTEPEQMWREYRGSVVPALTQLGYRPDADGSFNSHIKKMLNKKIDSNVFLAQVPTFIRATQNAEFAGILNEWAKRDLGKNINFNDWFGLMAGESQPELEDVAERATLQWVAENQGTQLSRADIEGIAAKTQLDPMEAQRAFAEFNQGILALGDEALGRYGLSREAVLSAAVGVAPTDGRTVDEIKLMVAKTAREVAGMDDEKINFYVAFDPMGRPTRPGLQALAPEGA